MSPRFWSVLPPLERWLLTTVIFLTIAIGGVLAWGDQTYPQVRSFNWESQVVRSSQKAMLFTFNRPMNRASVEQNLVIDPPLAGKFSWAGRRMAYTLDQPLPYGTTYQVRLVEAEDQVGRRSIPEDQPFEAGFRSPDRAFVYLGVEGEEESRLVLYNLTQQTKQILTPPNLVVVDFKPYGQGDRILFSASDRSALDQGQFDPQIYRVTTGLAQTFDPDPSPEEPGTVELLVDNQTYQNLKFDLSPDGKTIIIQRANKQNPGAEFGLWILREGQALEPLETQPGGEFLITPDSRAIVMAQGQGLGILPLEQDPEPLDFLPQFGRILSFAPDGTQAALVRFNPNYTRSLFWVNNQGQQKELWVTDGSILSATFDPSQTILYGLITTLLPGEEYQEEPLILAIDLKTLTQPTPESQAAPPDSTQAIMPLLRIPDQRDVFISLAPDGLGILFDQLDLATTSEEDTDPSKPRSEDNRIIHNSRLWLLPLIPDRFQDNNPTLPNPEPLPLRGLRPHWIP